MNLECIWIEYKMYNKSLKNLIKMYLFINLKSNVKKEENKRKKQIKKKRKVKIMKSKRKRKIKRKTIKYKKDKKHLNQQKIRLKMKNYDMKYI